MKAIAENIRTTLSADSSVNALLAGRIYWGMGKQNEKEAIAIFSVDEILQGATPDSRRYATTIRCYAPDMDAASDVYEAVLAAMKAAGHHFTGGTGGISDDEEREGVMQINFNLI